MQLKEDHESLWVRLKPAAIFFSLLVSAVLITLLLREPGFSDSQVYVMFLMFFAIGLWVTEVIPPFSVSLLIIAFLVFALGNPHLNTHPEPVDEYVNTFSGSIIWLLLGGFFLASSMTKTGLDVALFRFTLRISGNNPKSLLLGLMVTTMVASMVMSNTATTAVVIAAITPLLNSLDRKSGVAKAFLLGVPVAASTGGMATIIGSPPNAIAAGFLETMGIKIDFLAWMVYGLPLAVVLTGIGYSAMVFFFLRGAGPVSMAFLEDHERPVGIQVRRQRRIVVAVMITTVLLWLTTGFHGLRVASISAVPLVILTLTGIMSGKDVRGLPWDTLLLVAGGLSLGLALQSTGLLSHYANKMAGFELGPIGYAFILGFLTMMLSNIMSHTATSTILIPLGMALAGTFRLEITLIVALASSTALLLPVSTPPNAIAFSTGLIEQKDFRAGGFAIGLSGPLLIILWTLALSWILKG